jgi:glycine/D-amino acid oxidase-like deaminating enzyme
VRARAILVAVDGRLEQLLPEVAVRTARCQMLATAPVAPRFDRPVYYRHGYDFWRQLPDGAIALGGCRDRGGPPEWTCDTEPSDLVQRHLDALLHDVLRVDASVTHRWAGPIGFTDHRLPVLAEVRPGVFATGGYCGTGNVLGPLCAQAAVRMALGADPGVLPALLTS